MDKTRVQGSLVKAGDYTTWHRIELNNKGAGPAFIVGNTYFSRATDKERHAKANEELSDSLAYFKRQGHHIILGGDFNAHTGVGGIRTPTALAKC